MKHAALTFWLMMLVVGSVGYGSWLAWREFGDSPSGEPSSGTSSGESGDSMSFNLPPGVPLPDFELTDQRGHKFHSSSLRGKFGWRAISSPVAQDLAFASTRRWRACNRSLRSMT